MRSYENLLSDLRARRGRQVTSYLVIGATCAALYLLMCSVLIDGLGINKALSSVIAYLLVLPVSFFANRSHTFRSRGSIPIQALRFTMVHAFNIALSAGLMQLSVAMGWHYAVGALLASASAPILTFLLLDRWAFRDPRSTDRQ